MIGTLLLAFYSAYSAPAIHNHDVVYSYHQLLGGTRLLALKSPSADDSAQGQPRSNSRLDDQDSTTTTSSSSSYGTIDNNRESSIGLYVHIPYCRRRCRYCNFAILPIGPNVDTDINHEDRSPSIQAKGFDEMNRSYLSALLTELKTAVPLTTDTDKTSQKIRLKSIYFGGGTPSLAPVETIAEILQAVCGTGDYNDDDDDDDDDSFPFVLEPDAEVSMEMDPGTFSTEKLRALKALGINRISLGVQSFDDKILETMGRVHRRADVFSALESINTVFGEEEDGANYSIDLISAVPGLTLAKWVETLQTAVALKPRPKHLSIYDLQVEEGTVFSTWYSNGDGNDNGRRPPRQARLPNLPSEEDCAFMYKYTAGYLRAKKYEHYEVSSYAYLPGSTTEEDGRKSKFRSQHNQIYWSPFSSWYALGLGATSCVDGKTVARPRTLVDYLAWVNDDERNQDQGDGGDDDDGYLSDIVLKRLRTADGLDLHWVRDRFGKDIVASIVKGAELGLDLGFAEIVEPDNGRILRLKDPEGLLYSNFIISSIFAELDLY